MNTNDINFAYKVRHALNENLDNLAPSHAERLVSARAMALSRKKSSSPLAVSVLRNSLATTTGNFFNEPFSLFGRMALALPAVVLVAGLVGLFQYEQQQRISETADIDAMVLADELPLSAYLDHGFNGYLANKVE